MTAVPSGSRFAESDRLLQLPALQQFNKVVAQSFRADGAICPLPQFGGRVQALEDERSELQPGNRSHTERLCNLGLDRHIHDLKFSNGPAFHKVANTGQHGGAVGAARGDCQQGIRWSRSGWHDGENRLLVQQLNAAPLR